MALPKSNTSRLLILLGLLLFILLPIVTFFYGMYFEKKNHVEITNPFCKKWETICDPAYTDPNGGCAPKKVCVDPSPTLLPSPQTNDNTSELNNLVQIAKTDLASNDTLPISYIKLISAEKVTWNDGSYGCPKPGFMYTQHVSQGYKIILSDGTKTSEYHVGETGKPFLCEHPSQ